MFEDAPIGDPIQAVIQGSDVDESFHLIYSIDWNETIARKGAVQLTDPTIYQG